MIKNVILLAGLALASGSASAQTVDVAANFTELTDIARIVAVFVGMMCFAHAIYGFYTWSKSGGNQSTIGKNVAKMFVGSMLVVSPWFYEMIKTSLGINTTSTSMSGDGARMILAIDANLGNATSSTGFLKYMPAGTFKAILAFIMFVGFISFVVGVYQLKDAQDPQGGGRGAPILSPVLKILGGIVCMNITWFSCLIASLIGISTLCIGK